MNIALISPYSDIYSYGLRILSALLKKAGHNVKVIFLVNNFLNRYEDKILDKVIELLKGDKLIGISLMTNYFDNVVQITQKLKKELNIPILWGGIHPTLRPQECLDYADMVCIGEGEETLVGLVKKIDEGGDYRDILGIGSKDKTGFVVNEIRPLIQDLDSIPFPDYDYENHYILDNGCIHKMSLALLKKYTKERYLTIPTRGCPFACTYCCNNALSKIYPNQRVVRKRSTDNLIRELMEVKTKLPIMKYIYFDDDTFFFYTMEELTNFCEKYKKNIGLPLIVTGITPATLTKEKLSMLVDAGLKSIRMGIQSGSERTRKLYMRNYSNQEIRKAAKIISEFEDKINPPQYDIILDNPWETDEDLIKTLKVLSTLPAPYNLSLFSLSFYPGTELYEMAKKEKIITDDFRDVYRHYYHSCRNTYLNKLFVLLHRSKGRMSTNLMSVLTSKTLMKLKLSWLLYIILKTKYDVIHLLKKFNIYATRHFYFLKRKK